MKTNTYEIIWDVYDKNLSYDEIVNVTFPVKFKLDEILKNYSNNSLTELEDNVEFQIIKLYNTNKYHVFGDCGFGTRNIYSLDKLKLLYEEYLNKMILKEKAKEEEKAAKEKAIADAKAAKEKIKAEAKLNKIKNKIAEKNKGFINTLF